jgi:site-specific DNA recombinase
MIPMRRAAVYCRISKSDPTQPKVEVQEDDCRRLAHASGYEVTAVYVDDGLSASVFKNRPGWQQLLIDISAGQVDVILATEEERFTRQPMEKEQLALTCTAVGAIWHTVRGGIIDPATAEGEFISGLTGLLARREVRRKAERQKSANAARRAKGEPLAGVRPFGFELNRIDHRESEAQEIRWATAHILQGGSLYSVSNSWNSRNIKTSRGNRWTPTNVKKALLRPRNAGLIDIQGQVTDTKAVWLPLVLYADWEQCAAILTSSSRSKPHKFQRWLASGIAVCGVCGEAMCSSAGKDRKESFPIYRCTTKAKQHLSDKQRHPTIKSVLLDGLIRAEIVRCFTYGTLLPDIQVDVAETMRLQARLGEVRQGEADLMELVGSPGITIATVQKRAAELYAEEVQLDVLLEEQAKQSASAAMISSTKATLWKSPVSFDSVSAFKIELGIRFDSLPLEQQRTLVRNMLKIQVDSFIRGKHKKSVDRVVIEQVQ